MKALPFFILILCLKPLAAAEKVYRILNEDGSYTFTDIPPGNTKAEKISVKEPNIVPAVTPEKNSENIDKSKSTLKVQTKASSDATNKAAREIYEISIFSPLDQSRYTTKDSLIKIDLGLSPELSRGHLVYLFLNGKQYGSGGNVLTRLIPSLPVGRHQISARVLDEKNNILGSTEGVTLIVTKPELKTELEIKTKEDKAKNDLEENL